MGLGPRLNNSKRKAGAEPPQKIAYRRTRPPYTASQVRHYLRLAEAQPTDGRRRSLTAVLALGLGCGLDGRDMAWVRDSDVGLRRSGALHVTVYGGSRPPTLGAVHTEAELTAVMELAARYGVRVVVDEIHACLVDPGTTFGAGTHALNAPAASAATSTHVIIRRIASPPVLPSTS